MKAEPTKNISQIFADGTLIDKALNDALRQAVEDHRRAGVPMVFWQDGKIVWIAADQVRLDDNE